MNLHYYILDTLRAHHEGGDNPLAGTFEEFTNDELCYQFFHSYRPHSGNSKGFRLTDEGLLHFKSLFESWEIKLVDAPLNSRQIIFLDRYFNMPYHFVEDRFTLFEKQPVIDIKIAGNNLNIYMEMRTKD